MSDNKYNLKATDGYVIGAKAAEALIAAGDGDAALLYLFMLSRGGVLNVSDAANKMKLPRDRIVLAADRLAALNIVHSVQKAKEESKQPDELPAVSRYTADEMAQIARENPELKLLLREAEKKLGRIMSSSEYARLIGLYSELGLSAETILLLINHCCDVNEKRGKRTTMRDVERLGYNWAGREIFDVQSAEEHLKKQQELETEENKIKEAVQIKNRNLSPTEKKYIDSWIEMGYSADTLSIAYDKTVVNTGKLVWIL